MLQGDWTSDVCSADLSPAVKERAIPGNGPVRLEARAKDDVAVVFDGRAIVFDGETFKDGPLPTPAPPERDAQVDRRASCRERVERVGAAEGLREEARP